MRILKLTMTAFGPYKGTEVIDFRELGEQRLFVISGMTGAGKTTIFDGISFALYGSGSGQDRKDTKSLRSDFAEDAVHTATELLFEVHGRTYRVLRQLGHVKAGNKTMTGEKYELYEVLADGTEQPAIERMKVTEVNRKIEEILGLTQDQFSQIIMLPQGEFRKLLTSESENKEQILRKIFKTDRYGEMLKKLDTKRKQAEAERAQAQAIQKSIIEQIIGALPTRESILFEVVQSSAVNMHQILNALNEETMYYEQQILQRQQDYDTAFAHHHQMQTFFLQAQQQNNQLLEHQKRQQQLATLEAERPLYEAKKAEWDAAERANQLQPFEQQIQDLQNELAHKQQALHVAQQNLQQAQDRKQQLQIEFEIEQNREIDREQATERVLTLKSLIPVFEELEEKRNIVNQLTIEVQRYEQTMQRMKIQRDESLFALQQTTKTIEQYEIELIHFDDLTEHLNTLRDKEQIYRQLDKHAPIVKDFTNQLQHAEQQKLQFKQHYEQLEKQWLSNQASLLASKLVEGEPCPVCGSPHHQRPHHLTNEQLDEVQLEQLKQQLIVAEQHYVTIYAHYTSAQQHEERLLQQLTSLGATLEQRSLIHEQYMDIGQRVEHMKQQKTQLVSLKEVQKDQQQTYEQLQQQVLVAEQAYQQYVQQLQLQTAILQEKQQQVSNDFTSSSDLAQEIQLAEQQKQQLYQQWQHIQQQLTDTNQQRISCELQLQHCQQSLNEVIDKLNTATQQFNKQLTAALFESYDLYVASKRTTQQRTQLQHAYTQYMQNVHILQSKVHDDQMKLAGVEWQDLQQTEQQLVQLKTAYEQSYHMLNQSKDYVRSCQDFFVKLQDIAEKVTVLEEKSVAIIDLYDVLRGQNSKKISFERYVQIGYLEQITYAANRRLKYMSDGQYTLHCSNRQESHGRQSGLSLDVFDEFTGQMRDVKSLSGGEKFNASLCLALGMADVIQSFQGNIRIDTMFIDEGFGSLDQETLAKAIDTLIDLQKSGRMIGVISHVEELKNAMPAILQVMKSKEGYSTTKFIMK